MVYYFEIVFPWFIIFSLLVIASSVSMRVGVFCLAIESIFLNSAFAMISMSKNISHSLFYDVIFALIVGLLTGFVFAVLTLIFNLDEIITAIAINIFSTGITSYTLSRLFNTTSIELSETIANSKLVLMISLALWVFAFFIFEKSVLRARFCALKDISSAASLANISYFYRFFAIMTTAILASTGGVYFALTKKTINQGQWQAGISFLAIGIAFASKDSFLVGAVLSLILAGFSCFSLYTSYSGLNGILAQASPYLFVLTALTFGTLLRKGFHVLPYFYNRCAAKYKLTTNHK